MNYDEYRKKCLKLIKEAFLKSLNDQKDRYVYNGQNNEPLILERQFKGSKYEIARVIITDCTISLSSPKHIEKNIAFTFQA